MDRLTLVGLALVLAGCPKAADETPVCGLHSASAPVVLEGSKRDVALSVGARLRPGDRIEAEGYALVECFGGALKVLEKDKVVVGELKEAKIEAITIPRFVLKDGKPVKVEALPPSVMPRYSDNRFTPRSALASNEPSSGDYFRAFFTPNGIENMANAPREEGPSKLPPPSARVKVSRIHAGELGPGAGRISVEDEAVFAETDDLATAVLLEDETYALGRTVRVIVPDGAEATLELESGKVDLDGPMDLRLR